MRVGVVETVFQLEEIAGALCYASRVLGQIAGALCLVESRVLGQIAVSRVWLRRFLFFRAGVKALLQLRQLRLKCLYGLTQKLVTPLFRLAKQLLIQADLADQFAFFHPFFHPLFHPMLFNGSDVRHLFLPFE